MSRLNEGPVIVDVDYRFYDDNYAGPYRGSPNAETVRYLQAHAEEMHIYAVDTGTQQLIDTNIFYRARSHQPTISGGIQRFLPRPKFHLHKSA